MAPSSDVPLGSAGAPSEQLFHTCYPHAFCDRSNQPVTLNGFNIRNVGIFQNATTLVQMRKIRDRGFNAVRLVIRWDVLEPAPGRYSEPALSKIDSAVANAKAAGVYAILDPIHLSARGTKTPDWATGDDSVAKVSSHAAGYIEFMTRRYAREKTVVAIDLVNEPWQANYDHARLVAMYNILINAARSADQDKILLFEPQYGASLLPSSAIAGIINKSNLVFSPHDYFGGTKNADGSSGCRGDTNKDGFVDSSGGECGNYVFNGTAGYYFPNLREKEAHVEAWIDHAGDHRIPVFIGEYGIGDRTVNSELWLQYMTLIHRKHLGRTFWEYYSEGPFSATRHRNGPGDFKSWVDILK